MLVNVSRLVYDAKPREKRGDTLAIKKNKGGRPRRHAGQRLSQTRSFRVRGDLDDVLRAAAAKAGRSVSEQIEWMLETAFFSDRLQANILGSELGAEILRLIRVAMATEGVSGRAWSEDPTSAENVRVAANAIISVLAKLPLEFPPDEKRVEGLKAAKLLLLKSSAKGHLPNEIMFSDLEPLDFGERKNDDP
jgi:hypothetical protein